MALLLLTWHRWPGRYDVLRAAQRDPAAAAQLTWQRRLEMALDAAMGLLYLHRRSPPIVHRDGQPRQRRGRWLRAAGEVPRRVHAAPTVRPPALVAQVLPARAPAHPAVKSPNLLVDASWRTKGGTQTCLLLPSRCQHAQLPGTAAPADARLDPCTTLPPPRSPPHPP